MPRTAPDPQQFQLAAALHPASRNKRTNTQDKLTAFLSTSFKTLCCKTHCHLSLFPAQVSTGPQTTFFHSGAIKTFDVIPKLFPTSFLKTSRQAHNPAATCPQTSSDAGSTFFPAHNFLPHRHGCSQRTGEWAGCFIWGPALFCSCPTAALRAT